MDAVDKLPDSTAREQRAIDLRIEARLAFVSLGNIERWFGLGRDGEARSEKIGDEGQPARVHRHQGGGAEFLWNAL